MSNAAAPQTSLSACLLHAHISINTLTPKCLLSCGNQEERGEIACISNASSNVIEGSMSRSGAPLTHAAARECVRKTRIRSGTATKRVR
jgi:hypothetical protein